MYQKVHKFLGGKMLWGCASPLKVQKYGIRDAEDTSFSI